MNEHLLAHSNKTKLDLSTLDALSRLVLEHTRLKNQIADDEEDLKFKKAAFTKIAQESIPQFMLQRGIAEVKTAEGIKVVVKDDVGVSVSDLPKFAKFLEKRGDADIMKTTLELGKVPHQVLNAIVAYARTEFDIIPDIGQKVHPATLKKYVRELCGIGGDTEAECTVEELKDMLSIFQFHKTTVK